MRKKYLICYDISDDKRRVKVARELLKWTFRTQKSVYEGNLTELEVKKIIDFLIKVIKWREDVVYIFEISQKESKSILRFGANSDFLKNLFFF